MHATQPRGGSCPEPRQTSRADDLVGLLGDDVRFRTWIAQAVAPAAQPLIGRHTAASDDMLTDADCAAFGVVSEPVAPLAVPGWCEKCGNVLPWVCTWDEPLCSDCVTVIPALPGEGCESIVLATPDEAPGTCARVLQSAALYLERHGWIQGAYYDTTSPTFTPAACMVGAIAMVCYGGPVDAPAQHFDDPGFLDFEEAVLHLDRYLLVENSSESYEFNDARGRTSDEVADVLRKAAARPAEELIDALQVIDARNADVAALAELLKPCGIWGASATPEGGEAR